MSPHFAEACFPSEHPTGSPAWNHGFFFLPEFDVPGRCPPISDHIFDDVSIGESSVERGGTLREGMHRRDSRRSLRAMPAAALRSLTKSRSSSNASLYFLQQWCSLADEDLEDAVYDSQAMHAFLGIPLAIDLVPDATTGIIFRHLGEKNDLCATIFETINAHLEELGGLMREGTLVDAIIINAPSITKNKDKARDPEMHQTKKENQWYFGMKAPIRKARNSGLVYSVVSTATNISDISQTAKLLHGQENQINGDAGYVGIEKRKEIVAEDPNGRIDWQIAKKRGAIKKREADPQKELIVAEEKTKASERAFVEHPFYIFKKLFELGTCTFASG